MISSRRLPDRLSDVFKRWDAGGRQPQGVAWHQRSWETWLPQHRDLFNALPERIDRRAVAAQVTEARHDPDAAVRAFVAAMVWGHGPVGYGPFRTARVLKENADAPQTLAEVARRVWEDGGPEAFSWLARNRLSGLGVAFATKYLCFCSMGSPSEPALVLDRLVRGWLTVFAGWRPRLDWRVQDYGEYVRTVVAWGKQLGISPYDVEYLMFVDAAEDATRQWHVEVPRIADNMANPRVRMARVDEQTAVLDAIEQVADAFAELADGWHMHDVEDFESNLRHLRRIVLARPFDDQRQM